MTVQNLHDHFFKDSFGRLSVARGYLEAYLPEPLRNEMDLAQLQLQDGSFIDEEMQAHQSDLLYQVPMNSGQDAFVYLLFEHKSYTDPLVALQLLRYMVRIWERLEREQRPLIPILPLVIYHGEREWRISTQFIDLFELPEPLRPYFPNFYYHLTDFSYRSDEAVQGSWTLQAIVYGLRLIRDPNWKQSLGKFMYAIRQIEDLELQVEIFRAILYYWSRGKHDITYEDLERVALQQGPQGKDAIMTVAEELMQKGREEGKEEGREEGKAVGRVEMQHQIARQLLKLHDVITVSELTGLSIEAVEALQGSATDS